MEGHVGFCRPGSKDPPEVGNSLDSFLLVISVGKMKQHTHHITDQAMLGMNSFSSVNWVRFWLFARTLGGMSQRSVSSPAFPKDSQTLFFFINWDCVICVWSCIFQPNGSRFTGSTIRRIFFRDFETWDNVVDGDVPEKVEQTAYQPNHQDPNWRRKKCLISKKKIGCLHLPSGMP